MPPRRAPTSITSVCLPSFKRVDRRPGKGHMRKGERGEGRCKWSHYTPSALHVGEPPTDSLRVPEPPVLPAVLSLELCRHVVIGDAPQIVPPSKPLCPAREVPGL